MGPPFLRGGGALKSRAAHLQSKPNLNTPVPHISSGCLQYWTYNINVQIYISYSVIKAVVTPGKGKEINCHTISSHPVSYTGYLYITFLVDLWFIQFSLGLRQLFFLGGGLSGIFVMRGCSPFLMSFSEGVDLVSQVIWGVKPPNTPYANHMPH